jgi:hypothetical protein
MTHTTTTQTIAERIAEHAIEHGCDDTRDMLDAETVWVQYARTRTSEHTGRLLVTTVCSRDMHDVQRHEFIDGSAIVIADGGWDVEGAHPWSWAGAGEHEAPLVDEAEEEDD